jgi:anti-sigma regulatory factor (Ser/Thr protein kinase)
LRSRVIWKHTLDHVSSEAVRTARADFIAACAVLGVAQAELEAFKLIHGELLANACEHGVLPVTTTLCEGDRGLSLCMLDSGTGIVRPRSHRPLDALRGRGFDIVEQLGGKLHIAAHPRSEVCVALPTAAPA